MRRRGGTTLAFAIVTLACGRALAAPPQCPATAIAWLRVSFGGDGFAPGLQSQVAEQLGGDLGGQHVALCDGSSATPASAPLADVTLTLSSSSSLSLEVVDAVTDKRMARQIALGSVPRDALPLSIALAAEELLHASWIEAALAPPPSPVPPAGLHPVPPAVQAIDAEVLAHLPRVAARPAALLVETSLVAAVERATGGQTDLGGDVRVLLGGRLAASARVGVRASLDVPSAHGVVRGRETLAGLGADYALLGRASPWGAEVAVRADLVDVQFEGIAAAGAQGSSGSGLGAAVDAAVGGWRRLGGPWRLVGEVALGVPLRAVTASDTGMTATGVSGVSFGATLGVAATLAE